MDLFDADWDRLDRYVSRRGTPEELAELEQWVNASRERRVIAESMRAAGRPAGEGPQVWDTHAARRQVGRRMRWFTRPPLHMTPVRRVPRWAAGMAAAAVVALAAGAALFLPPTPSTKGIVAADPAAGAREVVTRRGERASFNLADGSKVMLGAESRLVIPASYNTAAGGRQLRLEGEGYFEVTHDSLRPFRVVTSGGVAEDLGTEFVVTAYPETPGMQVVVASGLVALRRAPAPGGPTPRDTTPVAMMTAGDLGRLDATGKVTLRRVDPALHLAWTTGALVFDGTPLRDVLPRLGRWYDVDVRLADSSLAGRPLTATFRTETAFQALDLVALSLNLHVQRQGRTLILMPKPTSKLMHRPNRAVSNL